jgi:hypothetical protein
MPPRARQEDSSRGIESVLVSQLPRDDSPAAELLQVPRLLAPTSHVLAEVLRRDRGIPDSLRPYFADVQDRALHVLAGLDTVPPADGQYGFVPVVAFLACMVVWGFIHSRRLGWL